AAEETGIAGLLCIAAFVAILLWHLVHRMQQRDAIAIGLAFALVAVALHSLSDYGQHIPAVACLAAVICGLIVAPGARSVRSPRCPIAAILIAIAIWISLAGLRNWQGDRAWTAAETLGDRLRERHWVGSDADFDELLQHVQNAVQYQPGN